MKKFFLVLFGTAFLGWFILVGDHVYAQSLRVSPPLLEFTVSPGQSLSRMVRLTNDSDTATVLSPSLYQVVSQDTHGFPKLAPLVPGSLLAKLVSSAEEKPVTIASHKTVDIPVNITAPKDVQSGGYYAVLSWSATGKAAQIGIVPTPGVNLIVTIPGTVERRASIVDFSAQRDSDAVPSSFTRFIIEIKNEGGIHILPTGTIEIRNIFGSVVAKIPLSPQNTSSHDSAGAAETGGNILPGATREFYGAWKSSFALGLYSALLRLDIPGVDTVSKKISFMVIPTTFAYLWLTISFFLLIFIIRRLVQTARHIK